MRLNFLRVLVVSSPFIFIFIGMGCNRPFDPVSPFPAATTATPQITPTSTYAATVGSAISSPTATPTP